MRALTLPLYVHGYAVARLDEIDRELGIGLVGLGCVGQPHRDEAIVLAVLAELVDGQLRQLAAGAGVDPAANTEHEVFHTAQFELVLDEIDATADFEVNVDLRRHFHFGNDFGLFHGDD